MPVPATRARIEISAELVAHFNAELVARFNAELAAESAALEAAGALVPPGDLCDPDDSNGPALLSEEDLFDTLPPMSRIDAMEWELWAGVEQDEAEREMLRRKAPSWVFLPPGAELAAALEPVRPQCESPIALIELMKAASRMVAWAESIKTAAMASFYRQRKAQSAECPRPTQIDTSGRPIDPERSWAAEVGAALHLSTNTATRHLETALHLTGTLHATHTALRCGALSWSKALSISEGTRSLPDDAAQAVESHVLRRAPSQTHANLNRSLRTQVAKYAATAEADRHREAISERTCKIVPLPNGMAGLWVVHTADKIQQMWVVIQAMADLAKRSAPTPPSTPSPGSDPTPTPRSERIPPPRSEDTSAPRPNDTPARRSEGTPAAGSEHTPTPRSEDTSARGSESTSARRSDRLAPNAPQARRPKSTPTAESTPTDLAPPPRPTPKPTSTPGPMLGPTSTPGSTLGPTSRPAPTLGPTSIPAPTLGPTSTPGSARESASAPEPMPEPTTPPASPVLASTPTLGPTPSAANPSGREATTSCPPSATTIGSTNDTTETRTREERTAPQRRADVVADVFEQMLRNGLDCLGRRLPDQHRRRPHIEVLIPATTLLGLDDDPAELTGYGPIPADMARRIAADGTWRRLLTDPVNGAVLEASTTRHDPGSLVSETLLARHPVCAWPGCSKPARECDRDHGTPFAQSGRTSLTGLVPYCEYHHVIKDTPTWGWSTTNNPDGSVTLTAPTGHRYTTVPPARGPITPPTTSPPPRMPPPTPLPPHEPPPF